MHPTIGNRLYGVMIVAAAALAPVAHAQPRGPVWDVGQLPETRGMVRQYTLTPRGDIDGLLLTDGTEIKLPPRLSSQVAYVIRPTDEVSVRGLRASAARLVDAVSITQVSSGRTIVEADRGAGGPLPAADTCAGTIERALHGRRGEINGVLLRDGTMLRLPPHEALRLAAWLEPGQTIAARGSLLDTALGRVFEATAIGPTAQQLVDLDTPRAAPGPRAALGGPPAPRAAPGGVPSDPPLPGAPPPAPRR